MKNYLRFLSPVLLLLAVLMGGGKIYADEVTYTVASKTSVTPSVSLTGVTTSFKNTYDSNKEQLTKNNSMTLTISGFKGKVSAFRLEQAATSTGKGSLSISINGKNVVDKVFAARELGTNANDFKERIYNVDSPVSTSGDIIIVLSATVNSLYCKSFTVIYDPEEDKRTATTLSFGSGLDNKEYNLSVGDAFESPIATLTPSIEGANITYSSNNTDVAKVDEATGTITLGKYAGSAIITANYNGDSSYKPSSCSYTINLKKASAIIDGYFDFDNTIDYGSGLTPKKAADYNNQYDKETTWTAGNVTLVTTNTRWTFNNNVAILRFYESQNSTLKASVPAGYHITKITLNGAPNFSANCGSYNSNNTTGTWSGYANEITFNCTSKKDMKSIEVIYAPDETLTPATSGYATYAADYAVNYSEQGLTAYAVKVATDKSKVSATPFTGVVPAGKAVLVKGTAGQEYTLTPATTAADETFDTDLLASDGTVTADGAQHFAFGTKNGVSGFKLVNSGVVIPAKKGYLLISNAGAKEFFAFEGETTGISVVETAPAADGNVYNMAGQRVSKNYKGLVIVGGKKYLNK